MAILISILFITFPTPIPRIPTLIPCISIIIPRISTPHFLHSHIAYSIPTRIPYISSPISLLPRIRFIPFPNSPF